MTYRWVFILLNLSQPKQPESPCTHVQILTRHRNGFEGSEVELEEMLAGKVGWPGFKEVFTLSAKDNQGLEPFKEYLLHSAVPRLVTKLLR